MKVIDLLNRVANKTDIPKKIKCIGVTFKFNESGEYVGSCGYTLFDFVGGMTCLNDEVEILDNETNDIEEITYITSDENTMICIQKINELVKAINKLNNQDTSKETNCMSD